MNGIIKTKRKEDPYARIYNRPLQPDRFPEEGLKDLRAIGLLSYIMSLPETFTLFKTKLQNTFTRKNVQAAWKELAEKKYAIELICYVDGKKKHFYQVADFQFTQEDFDEFAIEQITYLQNEGKTVKSPKSVDDSPLEITKEITNVLLVQQSEFTNVPRVQYSEYNTKGTYINEIKTNEIHKNKIIKELEITRDPIPSDITPSEFKFLIINESNEFYSEIAPGRYNKTQWNKLIEKFANDTVSSYKPSDILSRNLKGFIYISLTNIADNSDYKKSDEKAEYDKIQLELAQSPINTKLMGNLPEDVPFYNWLKE